MLPGLDMWFTQPGCANNPAFGKNYAIEQVQLRSHHLNAQSKARHFLGEAAVGFEQLEKFFGLGKRNSEIAKPLSALQCTCCSMFMHKPVDV